MAAKKSDKKPIVTATGVDGSSPSVKVKAPARKPKAVVVVGPEVLAAAEPVAPTHDEIRERAHAVHLGGAGGSSMENWLQAERELRSERGISA